MSKKLLEVAADIVQSQVAQNRMSSEEIVASLKDIFGALVAIKNAEDQEAPLEGLSTIEPAKAADPKESIKEDKIVCLECGAEMRQITMKHLLAHDLTPREYKKKWGFPIGTALLAKSLAKARRKAAKKRGIPVKLQEYIAARRQAKIEAANMMPMASETGEPPKVIRRRSKKTVA